ncbi:MAG: hypothetical protein J5884_07000 [Paludibacteraceae bacterium]|nr:hypothetical protein [Paludibacteraceae bacterium]
MKKIYTLTLMIVATMSIIAQTETTEMRLWVGNTIICQKDITQIDSITFVKHSVPSNPEQPETPVNSHFNALGFTINEDGDQVVFSQGNLQYHALSQTWRFAENQFDFIGEENKNISSTYNGWIDLFGWGTSGYNNITNDPFAINYQPWSYSREELHMDGHGREVVNVDCSAYTIIGKCDTTYDWQGNAYDYNRYGYGPSKIADDGTMQGNNSPYDWGAYNPIANGGNTKGQWRILRGKEWHYLLNKRVNAQYLFSLACVCGVKGFVILPDGFQKPSQCSWTHQATNFTTNDYDASTWQYMEEQGAVFLPAAGHRTSTSFSVGDGVLIQNKLRTAGLYWMSTIHYEAYDNTSSSSSIEAGGGGASCLVFTDEGFSNSRWGVGVESRIEWRYYGCSVRLAQDITQ